MPGKKRQEKAPAKRERAESPEGTKRDVPPREPTEREIDSLPGSGGSVEKR